MKYQKSDRTKSLQKKANFCMFLSIFCTFFPLLFYTIKAFIEGTPGEKFTFGFFVTAAAICAIFCAWRKIVLRSTIWILLLGIYIALDYIMPLILMVAISTILDEIIFTPLYKKFKLEYKVNNEIDKR